MQRKQVFPLRQLLQPVPQFWQVLLLVR
jgi:hypothetical protein